MVEKNLHMVFIDLEKAYDIVPRDVFWWALKKKVVPVVYMAHNIQVKELIRSVVEWREGSEHDYVMSRHVRHQGHQSKTREQHAAACSFYAAA